MMNEQLEEIKKIIEGIEKQKQEIILTEKQLKETKEFYLKKEKEMTLNAEKEKKEKERSNRRKNIDRGMNFTEVREYLQQFKSIPDSFYSPKNATETTDLHLDNKEIVTFVNPKKFPEEEIKWNEFKDIPNYWSHKEYLLWIAIFLIAVFFAVIYFSYWEFIL